MSLLLAFLMSTAHGGSAFSGFKQTEKEAYYTFQDTIHKIVDTDAAFYISFTHSAAFYTFPKDASAKPFGNFLADCKAKRISLKVEFNPYTAEIYRLSTK